MRSRERVLGPFRKSRVRYVLARSSTLPSRTFESHFSRRTFRVALSLALGAFRPVRVFFSLRVGLRLRLRLVCPVRAGSCFPAGWFVPGFSLLSGLLPSFSADYHGFFAELVDRS